MHKIKIWNIGDYISFQVGYSDWGFSCFHFCLCRRRENNFNRSRSSSSKCVVFYSLEVIPSFEDLELLGCDVASTDKRFPDFLKKVVPSPSRCFGFFILNTKALRSFEMRRNTFSTKSISQKTWLLIDAAARSSNFSICQLKLYSLRM